MLTRVTLAAMAALLLVVGLAVLIAYLIGGSISRRLGSAIGFVARGGGGAPPSAGWGAGQRREE